MHCAHYLLLLAGLLVISHSNSHIGVHAWRPEGYEQPQYQYRALEASTLKIAPSNVNFAFRLYHLIAAQSSEKNIFFSPFSISAGLAMLSLGASGDSRTQILKNLGLNITKFSVPEIHEGFRVTQRILSLPVGEVEVLTGNALVMSQDLSILPEFIDDVSSFYNAKLLRTNFKDVPRTTQFINDYVKKQTREMITDVVSGLSPDIRMVLLNYIYFRVVVRDFHVDENTVVKVPMMLQDQQEHWYLQDRRVPCSVLRMDYQGEAAAFFILPHEGKMKDVEQVLSLGMLLRWNRLLENRYFYRKVELYLPKFSITNSYALDQILPDLGFQDLFSTQADFSGITKDEKLKLSKSLHKATLKVNEIGTEAAASTSVSVSFLSAQRNHRVLMFNRPFILVIFSTRTRNILFLGKVINPIAQ